MTYEGYTENVIHKAIRDLDRKEDTYQAKKDAITAAVELGYSDKVISRIKVARTENEIYSVLCQARTA